MTQEQTFRSWISSTTRS